jgi:hypothetical protein
MCIRVTEIRPVGAGQLPAIQDEVVATYAGAFSRSYLRDPLASRLQFDGILRRHAERVSFRTLGRRPRSLARSPRLAAGLDPLRDHRVDPSPGGRFRLGDRADLDEDPDPVPMRVIDESDRIPPEENDERRAGLDGRRYPLPVRNQETINNHLAYVEFLELLVKTSSPDVAIFSFSAA